MERLKRRELQYYRRCVFSIIIWKGLHVKLSSMVHVHTIRLDTKTRCTVISRFNSGVKESRIETDATVTSTLSLFDTIIFQTSDTKFVVTLKRLISHIEIKKSFQWEVIRRSSSKICIDGSYNLNQKTIRSWYVKKNYVSRQDPLLVVSEILKIDVEIWQLHDKIIRKNFLRSWI